MELKERGEKCRERDCAAPLLFSFFWSDCSAIQLPLKFGSFRRTREGKGSNSLHCFSRRKEERMAAVEAAFVYTTTQHLFLSFLNIAGQRMHDERGKRESP